MKLTIYGAAGEVGRSCILLESNGARILMDAGVKLGEEVQYPLITDDVIRSLDGIVISHAHLDHCGYLPHIYSTGFKGNVYCTKPTFELAMVLASDYLSISKPSNVTKEGMLELSKHFKSVEYRKEFKIKDLTLKLFEAGHILGSAMIEAAGNNRRVLYTGDVNLKGTNILDPAHTDHLNADILITESTYSGDNDVFPAERIVLNGMLGSIKETLNRGGKVIIPSFAVGRGQEVLFVLDNYMRSGALPKVPIYVDGMINKALRIHRHNVIYCRDELQKRILMSEDDPFKSPNFVPVTSKAMRSKIMREQEGCIIVTTSGMISGGPIMDYLTRLSGDEKNRLILVGYQAEGTRGRALQDGAKEMTLGHRKLQIRLDVDMYKISGHADRPQLMRLVSKVKNLRDVYIVHGEKKKAAEFSNGLKSKYDPHLPELAKAYDV